MGGQKGWSTQRGVGVGRCKGGRAGAGGLDSLLNSSWRLKRGKPLHSCPLKLIPMGAAHGKETWGLIGAEGRCPQIPVFLESYDK